MSNRALRESPKRGLSIREWLASPGRMVTRAELWSVLNAYHRSNRWYRKLGRLLLAFWRYLKRPLHAAPPKEGE